MSENMDHTKLPKIVRATMSLFVGLSLGSHYSISENKENGFGETVPIWGLPFLTFSICSLAVTNEELFNFNNVIIQIWFGGVFIICYLMGGLSLVGIIVQVIMLPFNIWKQFKKLI